MLCIDSLASNRDQGFFVMEGEKIKHKKEIPRAVQQRQDPGNAREQWWPRTLMPRRILSMSTSRAEQLEHA